MKPLTQEHSDLAAKVKAYQHSPDADTDHDRRVIAGFLDDQFFAEDNDFPSLLWLLACGV